MFFWYAVNRTLYKDPACIFLSLCTDLNSPLNRDRAVLGKIFEDTRTLLLGIKNQQGYLKKNQKTKELKKSKKRLIHT